MTQHQICIGFNPARVVVGNDETLPLNIGQFEDTKLLVAALSPEDEQVELAREELCHWQNATEVMYIEGSKLENVVADALS